MLHITVTTLKVIAGAWFLVGTGLTISTMHHLYSPAKQAERMAWRTRTMGASRAEALATYYRTNLGFFSIFWLVMLMWPVALKRTVQAGSEGR